MPAESSPNDRAELAAALHDHLAQDLVAARLKLAILQKTHPPGPGHELLAEAAVLVQRALNFTRDLMSRLEDPNAPAVSGSPPRDGEAVSNEANQQPREVRRPLRVLIADDHAAVRRVLKRILETDDSVELVGEATSGEEAVEMLSGANPDVILLDANMAGMNGRDAARIIRDRAPNVRIVGVSANRDHANALRAAGAVAVWTKGDSIEDLQRAIRT